VTDSALLPGSAGSLTIYGLAAGADGDPPRVIRVDPVTGTEVDTELPALGSSGPVSVLAEPDGVIIRPWDAVPGYTVRDGDPPRTLAGLLTASGPALPGAVPGTMWVPSPVSLDPDWTVMTLVDEAGRELGQRITLGSGYGTPSPDGDGGIVVQNGQEILSLSDPAGPAGAGPDGQIQPRGPGATAIGTGRLIAAGPTGFVYLQCTADQTCALIDVDRNGALVQAIDMPPGLGNVLYGALSPDGTHLAIAAMPPTAGQDSTGQDSTASLVPAGQYPTARPTLGIFDIAEATSWLGGWLTLDPNAGATSLAWTPDSGYLLVATGAHRLQAISADTHAVRTMTIGPATLTNLVVRPGS
jgi:hypothetical protein